jgi:hypothetical protein
MCREEGKQLLKRVIDFTDDSGKYVNWIAVPSSSFVNKKIHM